MIKVGLAKNEHATLISELEIDNFNSEAYTLEYINNIIANNHILKNNTNIFTICDDDELLGYIIFTISEDFTDIYKIFVRENDRQKGYGAMLIDKVFNLAKRYNSKKILIEVRSMNQNAIKFYEKNNFTYISIRKEYYKNPSDDALIYERKII